MMVLGDSAAIAAAARNDIGIYLTISGGSISVVARQQVLPAGLKGYRIAYIPGTVTHFGVYRTLGLGRLSERDIVPMAVQADQAEKAMAEGQVDAAAVYEPFTSQILDHLRGSATVARVDIYTFLAFDQSFVGRHPDLAKALLAAVYRAAKWGAASDANLHEVLGWIRQGQVDYLGSSSVGTGEPWLSQLRKETVDKPSYPMLPPDFTRADSQQHQQFQFLKDTGQVPAGARWEDLVRRVKPDVLSETIREGSRWDFERFDYSSEKLSGGERRL
jgi:ABC-type nitrate/sulfonate/bicarbonate transport system substrate-binding protein